MTDHVRFDRHDGIVDIVLNRPADGNLISTSVSVSPDGKKLETAKPQALFRIGPGDFWYTMTPDSNRFLLGVPTHTAPASITILLNWAPSAKK